MRLWLIDVVIGGMPIQIWESASSLDEAVASADARHGDAIPVRNEDGEAISMPNTYAWSKLTSAARDTARSRT